MTLRIDQTFAALRTICTGLIITQLLINCSGRNIEPEADFTIFPILIDIPRLPETQKGKTLYVIKNGFGEDTFVLQENLTGAKGVNTEYEIVDKYADYMKTTDWVNESIGGLFTAFSKLNEDECRMFMGILESENMNIKLGHSQSNPSIYFTLAINEDCDRSSVEKALRPYYETFEDRSK